MAIIGIDLGTTNSLICAYRDGKTELIPNALGSFMTRSAVSILEDETILVGALAAERLISHPETAAASFKSYMGTEHNFKLGNQIWKAHELSAFVLRQLKQDAEAYLGETVEEAVISVPAYFNDNQRSATKLAARLAGLSVTRLINEPSAAALYYHAGELGQESKYVVIDFGGGTLDVSIVDCFENIIEILSISGDNRLGGDDIDHAIVSRFLEEHALSLEQLPPEKQASLLRKAKEAKARLGEEEQVSIGCQLQDRYLYLQLSQELLRDICQPLFSRVRRVISQALKQSKIAPAELTHVLLVGGSSKMPVFVSYIEELFGTPPTVAEKTDEIIAHGAGMYAGIKERVLKDIIMTDVCPFSLGVQTYESLADQNPHMSILISRSSLLPISRTRTFCTLANSQTRICCQIFQGEHHYTRDNLKIGEISVNVPPGPAGKHFVKVTFTYDIDGILHVSAESSGGEVISTVILNSQLSLTERELEEKLQKLEEIRINAAGSDADRLLIARLERLFIEFVDNRRDHIQYLLSMLTLALESGDQIQLEKVREQVGSQLDFLEQEWYLDPLNELQASSGEEEKESEESLGGDQKKDYIN